MTYSRKILNLLVFLVFGLNCMAEPLTAVKVFAEVPLEVLDMIRPSGRLDMVDYYSQADSLVSVPNALGGQSRFEAVADDYLKVSVTPASTLEIKILPYKKSQIVMTLYTAGGDSIAKDTDVRFFDAGLQPLSSGKFLKMPDAMDFFNLKDSDISLPDFQEWLPFQTFAISTGPGNAPLSITLTTLQTLPSEQRDLLSPLLTPTLNLTWSGSRFK